MRALFPPGGDLPDVTAAVWEEPRGPGRWVMANMVASLDGAATLEGRSGSLGGPGDRSVFHALRSRADVILVGAGTVRAEGYRPPSADGAPDRRRAAGMAARPVVAVVTDRVSLGPDLPLFGDPSARPVVVTHRQADPERRAALVGVADFVEAGDDRVDVAAAVDQLVDRFGPTVLTEGGPTLLGAMHEADLVDEWCVTVAGTAVAGDARRIAASTAPRPRQLRLARVWTDGDELLVRYLRAG